MATSTEKNDFVGRAVAQVRDNDRNALKRGEITSVEFAIRLAAITEVKRRVRKFEAQEKRAWLSFLSSFEYDDTADTDEWAEIA